MFEFLFFKFFLELLEINGAQIQCFSLFDDLVWRRRELCEQFGVGRDDTLVQQISDFLFDGINIRLRDDAVHNASQVLKGRNGRIEMLLKDFRFASFI